MRLILDDAQGLGSPVGSILVGTNQFIAQAIRVRKVLGGGMRQAGILAAAGIYSLTNMIERLQEDHINAGQIARAIDDLKSDVISVTNKVRTNIILVKVNEKFATSDEFTLRLKKVFEDEEKSLGKSIVVKASEIEKGSIRLVTHANVTQNDVVMAIQKLKYVVDEFNRAKN
uniref:Aromatic amino acid beta-eliminating lyase/threonine aldolase domain-containing protein n=1 Tax=Strigamia maritima TaxID=126957 RepID=T1J1U6_STRMM